MTDFFFQRFVIIFSHPYMEDLSQLRTLGVVNYNIKSIYKFNISITYIWRIIYIQIWPNTFCIKYNFYTITFSLYHLVFTITVIHFANTQYQLFLDVKRNGSSRNSPSFARKYIYIKIKALTAITIKLLLCQSEVIL